MDTTNPLITLALNCYRCERYVREAVEGALAQTYTPLEILISDDCSPDRTFEIIQDAVKDYHGPHKIVLNRNPKNLGLARHQNRLFELAHGEWIVFQAGDDISVPERVERIAQEIQAHPKARCLHSRCEIIDEQSQTIDLPQYKAAKKPVRESSQPPTILGAGAVYHRDVYQFFGPLGCHVTNEDHVLPLRAALLGEIVFIETPLVRYRKHQTNLSGNDTHKPTSQRIAAYRNELMDSLYQELMDLQWFERKQPESFGRVERYRKFVQDDLMIAWLFSNYSARPELRLRLIGFVLTHLGCVAVLVSRTFHKVVAQILR